MQTFTFTIVVPPTTPDAAALLEALSQQVARYAGLPADEASKAARSVARLVAERLDGEPVTITFARPDEDAPVRVEIAGPGPAHALSWAARNGG